MLDVPAFQWPQEGQWQPRLIRFRVAPRRLPRAAEYFGGFGESCGSRAVLDHGGRLDREIADLVAIRLNSLGHSRASPCSKRNVKGLVSGFLSQTTRYSSFLAFLA